MPLSPVGLARVTCVRDVKRVYVSTWVRRLLSLVVGLKSGTEYVIKIVALQNTLRSTALVGKARTRKCTLHVPTSLFLIFSALCWLSIITANINKHESKPITSSFLYDFRS